MQSRPAPSGTNSDPALVAPSLNAAPGKEYADHTRIFQGIPGIESAGNGRLWAVWYAGGPDEPGEGPGNYVVLVTSSDDGKTWSGPRLVIDPEGPVRAFDPCLWIDPPDAYGSFGHRPTIAGMGAPGYGPHLPGTLPNQNHAGPSHDGCVTASR